jgi:hypothetical protein
MGAPVSLHLKRQPTQRHRNAGTDVVTKRHGAQEARTADPELLTGGKGSRDYPTARM